MKQTSQEKKIKVRIDITKNCLLSSCFTFFISINTIYFCFSLLFNIQKEQK